MTYAPEDAFKLIGAYTRHRMFVQCALLAVEQELATRALMHDESKMRDDEFEGFARISANARVNKFGSPGYKAALEQERPTIDLHYSRNTHHAEHFASTVPAEGMSFLDIIEMVCDWWGARKGYDDTRSWLETVKVNLEHKGKYLSQEQQWLVMEVATFLERIHG